MVQVLKFTTPRLMQVLNYCLAMVQVLRIPTTRQFVAQVRIYIPTA